MSDVSTEVNEHKVSINKPSLQPPLRKLVF